MAADDAQPLLDPAPRTLGVFPAHYAHAQTRAFEVQQKQLSLSAQDYAVTDLADGSSAFRVQGKALSMHMRKQLLDARGTELFQFHREIMHLHPTMVATRPGSDRPLLRVRGKIFTMHGELTVAMWNEAHACEEELVVRADWLDRGGEVRLGRGGPVVCAIKRKWFAKLIGTTYVVHVAPNVDAALMVALCICLDDVMNKK